MVVDKQIVSLHSRLSQGRSSRIYSDAHQQVEGVSPVGLAAWAY